MNFFYFGFGCEIITELFSLQDLIRKLGSNNGGVGRKQRVVSHFHFDDHGYPVGALYHGEAKPCCRKETKDHSLSVS